MTLEQMYNSIPIGRENAATKDQLMDKWNVSNERSVRLIISDLRNMDNGDEYIIVSFSGGKGYYRTADPVEIQEYKNETINRARHTFRPLKKVNRLLAENEGSKQIDFFEAEMLS